jgi:hypothetical protein
LIRLSVMPSLKYSTSGVSVAVANGRTASAATDAASVPARGSVLENSSPAAAVATSSSRASTDIPKASFGFLFEAPAKQALDTARYTGRQPFPVRIPLDNRGDGIGGGRARERGCACEHLKDHATKSPDIGTCVNWHPAGLFWAHVRHRPQDHPRLGQPGTGNRGCAREVGPQRGRVPHRLCETEIEDLHSAVGPQLDVGRLEIPVDDAPLVRGLQGLCDLSRDTHFVDWYGPCSKTCGSTRIAISRALAHTGGRASRKRA